MPWQRQWINFWFCPRLNVNKTVKIYHWMRQQDCRSGLFHSTSPGDHGHVWWGHVSTCNLPPLRNIHLSLSLVPDQTSLVCHFLTTLWMNSFHKASIENPECTLVYWLQSSPNTFDKSGSIQSHLRWQKKHDIKHTLQFMWRLKKKKTSLTKIWHFDLWKTNHILELKKMFKRSVFTYLDTLNIK